MIHLIASRVLVHALAQVTQTNVKYQVMINNQQEITNATPTALRMVLMQVVLAKAVVKPLGEGSISNIMRPIIGATNGTKTNLLVSREGPPRIRNNRTDATGTLLSGRPQWLPLRRRDSDMDRWGRG